MAASCLGLFGASLLYGDGMITPAVSVLSAVEGTTVVDRQPRSPGRSHRRRDPRVPVRHPAPRHRAVGRIFGPVMVVWFVVLGVLGVDQPRARPVDPPGRVTHVRAALPPRQRADRLPRPRVGLPRGDRRRGALRRHGPLRAEADPRRLVHPRACRRSSSTTWVRARCSSAHPDRIDNPFYRMAPRWALWPLVLLATSRDRDRVAGADLRSVLAHAAGGPARLPAPRPDPPDLGEPPGPDLRAGDQLGAAVRAAPRS